MYVYVRVRVRIFSLGVCVSGCEVMRVCYVSVLNRFSVLISIAYFPVLTTFFLGTVNACTVDRLLASGHIEFDFSGAMRPELGDQAITDGRFLKILINHFLLRPIEELVALERLWCVTGFILFLFPHHPPAF